jgi:hypothetical protein
MMLVKGLAEELLLTMPAPVHRWFQITDFRGLEGRAEGAECGIDIVCLLPDRAVIDPVDDLDFVPAGKRHADRVAGEFLHEHAEPGEKEFQEP